MNIPKSRLPIAYIELIAAFVGISVFSKYQRNKIINIFSDNTHVVAWLRKGKCSAGLGFKLLAAIEHFKRKHTLKLSVKNIPGTQNNSAEELSRGKNGRRLDVEGKRLSRLIRNPLPFWESCG